eukprot:scaffold115857_cov35-Prasinocladus_malaysianus.AAC.1
MDASSSSSHPYPCVRIITFTPRRIRIRQRIKRRGKANIKLDCQEAPKAYLIDRRNVNRKVLRDLSCIVSLRVWSQFYLTRYSQHRLACSMSDVCDCPLKQPLR